LNIARDTIYLYIQYLEKAGLITLVRKSGQGVKSVRKPQKIYLDNSVLLSVLSDLSEMDSFAGTRRETFFANQLSAVAKIAIPPRGDFVVNNSFTFEVGGKNKNRDQLQHADNNYWALDGIEIGHRTTIPLYLFGFLY
ncbi:AAA family ATPase, partial [Myxococcota bacterium]|nr:AAA family ATPase [Myxococcota bacterium]